MSNERVPDETIEANTPLVLEQWTLDVLNRVAERNLGFTEFHITYESGSNVGDNFMGIMLRVLVTGVRKNVQDSTTVMLKMPPMSAARRAHFQTAILFEREIAMYRDVLPMFVQFQLDKGLQPQKREGFFNFPKCYAFVSDAENDRYAIVMEDLRLANYRMFNKFDVINLQHVRFVMEELGKFHGISFALRDQRPELFEPLSEMKDLFLENVIKGNQERMMTFLDMSFEKAIGALNDDEVQLKAKMEKLRANYVEIMEQCVNTDAAGELSVLNHGDCWNNNMMYKYIDSSTLEPYRICLIDFQIARCASPILDLVYFLFTSTTKELRDEHWEDILSIYYKSLSTTIDQLDSDAERIFSYEVFRKELRKFGKFGVLVAPMLLQVITADPKDIPDMDKMSEEAAATGQYETKMFITQTTEQAYKKRMSDVLRDAESYGMLSEF